MAIAINGITKGTFWLRAISTSGKTIPPEPHYQHEHDEHRVTLQFTVHQALKGNRGTVVQSQCARYLSSSYIAPPNTNWFYLEQYIVLRMQRREPGIHINSMVGQLLLYRDARNQNLPVLEKSLHFNSIFQNCVVFFIEPELLVCAFPFTWRQD